MSNNWPAMEHLDDAVAIEAMRKERKAKKKRERKKARRGTRARSDAPMEVVAVDDDPRQPATKPRRPKRGGAAARAKKAAELKVRG